MCQFIGIEDLAANALIELIERGDGRRRIGFRELVDYGNVIVKVYSQKNREGAVLLISRDYTNSFIRDYTSFFYVNEEEEYLELKEGKTEKDLRRHFRAFLTVELIIAFTSKESLMKLGVA